MRRVFFLVAAVLALWSLAVAQESRSTITGHVLDAQGAVIGGAAVLVTNAETGLSVKLSTNQAGYFEAPLLNPGPYKVTAEATGFKKLVRDGITLQAADRRDVEMKLEVGAVTESISVTAEAPLIDVSRTDSGRTLDQQSVAALPVMANTVLTMIRYAPGVSAGVPTALLGPHSTQGAGTDYSNGTGVGGNTWTIDGAVSDGASGAYGHYASNVPNVDTVAETKILTTTFDGSFGHSSGLGIAIVTKSGANDIHGLVSDSYWNQRWNASSFFSKQNYYKNIASLNAKGDTAGAASAASKPIQPAGHSNMYVFNVTGPIRIPKIFDGRNKVFFTLSYNGERDAKPEEPSTYNRIVPTDANRKGDFSDLLQVKNNPAQYQLFDPYSTIADPSRPGHYIRTAIAGNVLPQQYIGLGQKFYNNYVKYYPSPNNWFDHSVTPDTNPYLSYDAPYNWKYGQWSGRMDMNLGSKLRAFGRYTQNHFIEYRGDWTANILPGFSNGNGGTGGGSGTTGVLRDDQNGVLDFVYTITPATMLHWSVAVSNWSSMQAQGDAPYKFKPSDGGLPSYLDQNCGNWCYLPQMGINGYSTVGITGTAAPAYTRGDTVQADLYHNRGNHSIRAGIDFRRSILSAHAGNNDSGYTFGNNYFRQCDDNCGAGYSASNLGLAWASFMMGMPTSTTISNNDSRYLQSPYYGWYVQDTWRVNAKLTLTLSLRQETELGGTERYGRYIASYDPKATLPISDAVNAGYLKNVSAYAAGAPAGIPVTVPSSFPITGAAIYATAPNAPSRAWAATHNWLPRIGFGYQVDSKTVVRGGYGVYYDTTDVNAVNWGPNQNYYSKSTNPTIYTTGANAIPVFDPLFSPNGAFPTASPLNNPFPVRADGTRYDTPLRDALGGMATVGSGWTFPNYAYPARQQRWRVSIEHQVFSHDVIEASYEGTYSSNLTYNVSSSLGVPSTFYNFTNTRSATAVTNQNWLTATVPNPYYGMTTAGTVPSSANASYPSTVTGNSTLWTWMATNTLFTGSTRQRQQLLFQTPNGNVNTPDPRFHSRTQMLEVSYNHRFSKGLTANFGYTWLQNRAGNSYFQGWNPADPTMPQVPYWNPIAGGQPQRIVATAVYELPFGRGKRFLQNKWVDLAVGGWKIAGTFQRQLGGLLGFGNVFYYGDPNSIKIANPTMGKYFDTTGCTTAMGTAACTSGFEERTTMGTNTYQYRFMPSNIEGLRGPGYSEIDGSISRTFRITERLGFDARLDALNIPNHSIMNGPDTSPTSSTFGQITGQTQSPNRFLSIKGTLHW